MASHVYTFNGPLDLEALTGSESETAPTDPQPGVRYGEVDFTARVELEEDGRWTALYDDQAGVNHYVTVENAGLANDPLYEWETGGRFLRAGTTLEDLTLLARSSRAPAETGDIEIVIGLWRPDSPARYLAGWDADGEIVNETALRDFIWTPSVGDPATAPTNDRIVRSFDLDHVVIEDSWMQVFVRQTGTIVTDNAFLYLNFNMRYSST